MTKRSARNIPVTELVANPANIRTDVGDVTELARAIKRQGVLSPLLVTEDPYHRGWLLLAGHRRLAAARQAELHAVPCFIHHDVGRDTAEQVVLMLMENVQRKNLSPTEKARAYGKLREGGLTPSDIARRTGIAVSSVHTHLALLDLDSQSLELVEAGEVTAGEAIAAVRESRQETRKAEGRPERGRPVVFEAYHFSWQHPLARSVHQRCDHTTRSKVGGVGCGQCWEQTIRENEQRHGLPSSRAEPSRAEPSRAEPSRARTTARLYDEAAVMRRLDGDHQVPTTPGDNEEIVRRAHSIGLNDLEIERRTGLPGRTVLRIRQRLDLPANVDAGGNPVRRTAS